MNTTHVIPMIVTMIDPRSSLANECASRRPSTWRRPTGTAKYPSPVLKTNRIALGTTSSAIRWSDHASPARYAARSAHRASEFSPARSAAQRMMQPKSSATAYTSVSVAFSHTVDMSPAASPAAAAAKPSLVHLAKRLARMPHPKAVHTADNRLIERANPNTEANIMLQTLPIRM